MKAAVIGCGRMGLRHIQALTEMGNKIVGIYDAVPQATEGAIKQFNLGEITFDSFEDLLKQSRPELVVIATTAPSHRHYIEESIRHGIKYILCEKPLSVSIADCESILALSKKNQVHVAVNHQMRFLEQYIKPKALAVSQEFGGLASINVTAGNFGMAMNGTHYFEMARFMFDEYPNKICAWFGRDDLPNPRGAQFMDKSGSVRMETKSGKRFYLDASADQGHGLLVNYVCKFGQITVDELSGDLRYTRRQDEFLDLPTTRYGQPSIIASEKIRAVDIIESTKSVITALIAGKGYPSIEDSTFAIRTLVAAYISNENNHIEVDIESNDLPKERVFPWA